MTAPVTVTRCRRGCDGVRAIDEPCPGCGDMVPGQEHHQDPPAQALHYSSAVIWDQLMQEDRDGRGPHARPSAVAEGPAGPVSSSRRTETWH